MPVSHFTIVVTPAEFQAAKTFYLAALAPLGYKELFSGPDYQGLGDASNIPDFFIVSKEDRGPTKNAHFAFQAPDKDAVHKFHEAALAAGAKDNGGPGFRVEYTPTYYAAYVHDVNGNNVEAVHFVTKDC